MTLTPTRRRASATLCAAMLLFAPLACSSDGDDRSAPSTSAARAGNTGSNQGTSGSKPTTPDDDVVFGFMVDGDSGTMKWTAELSSTSGGGDQPPIEGTWNLDGKPRHLLFTTFIDKGSVTFEFEGDGTAEARIIRGKATNPDDPSAGVDVVEKQLGKDLVSGEKVTFGFK